MELFQLGWFLTIGMSMMRNLKEQNLTLMGHWMGTLLELGLEPSTDFYYS